MNTSVEFILASQSPRRKQLLQQIGLSFQVVKSPYEEVIPPNMPPHNVVEQLADYKARPVSAEHPEALVLAADTVVVHQRDILGKPADANHATTLLQRLSGQTHTVYTGIALVHSVTDRRIVAHEATEVTFGPLTEEEISVYVAGGSPLDKAGAYGIQDLGAAFVRRIEGDFYNVMGLPLFRLYNILKTHFNDLISLTS